MPESSTSQLSEFGGSLRCEFTLNIAPIEVYAVWIHFSGSVNVGEHYCILTVPPPLGPYPSPMGFNVSMRDTVSGDLWVTNCISEEESGSFEFTLQFEPTPVGEPTWEFIILGGGTVVFQGSALFLIPECWHDPYPNATIEEATLIIDGDFPVVDSEDGIPILSNKLYPCYPNPFNPTTTIRFDLPRAVHVKLCVYNVKGALVSTIVDQHMLEGRKEISWSATDNRGKSVASGIYFYRLIAGDFVQTKKMVLLW